MENPKEKCEICGIDEGREKLERMEIGGRVRVVCRRCREKGQAEKLYSLKLHEGEKLTEDFFVYRVPGGWIYERKKGMVFVPYDNSFEALIDNSPIGGI
jgi:hypothetical protein